MADPADLLNAWAGRDPGRRRRGCLAASGPAGLASDLVRPLQHQAELVERVLQRQLEFERELVGRAVAPARAAHELVEQARDTFRAQAIAFRAASEIFGQLADLMEQQAELVERASAAIRDPIAAVRSTRDDVARRPRS